MSVWTHVAAIVRVDSLSEDYDFHQIFGRELEYEDSFEKWKEYDEHPELFLPAGSEGSLTMSVWKNPNRSHIARYTVSIFGDLRDYADIYGIVEWFRKKVKELPARNACIVAENGVNTATWALKEI